MSRRADTILAATFGCDVSDVREARYQHYSSPAVFAFGDRYFAVAVYCPRHSDVGGDWRPHTDQFWAHRAGTTVWVCDALTRRSGA